MLGEVGYLREDTIAALASGSGGAITLVRLSGPRSWSILESLTGRSDFEPWRATLAVFKNQSGDEIDHGICVPFRSPKSFTGEDSVEFQIHGGGFNADQFIAELIRLGARIALPGEFSFRAVRNGKMTLSQAHAVVDLIQAANEDAHRLALEKISGTQNQFITDVADQLRELASLAEVGIDFSDQDVDEVSLPTLKAKLKVLLECLDVLKKSFDRGQRIQDGFKLALVGEPNAGKSSFFNSILGSDRAIVTEIPGTTRDIVSERLSVRTASGMLTLRLEDTAGLRQTKDRVEREGIKRSIQAAKGADLVIWVIDGEDCAKKGMLPSMDSGLEGLSVLPVFTKKDLLSEAAQKKLSGLASSPFLISSKTGEGVQAVLEEAGSLLGPKIKRARGEVLLTRLDQLEAVNQGLDCLERADQADLPELFAADIRHALYSLTPLIGNTIPDDLLGRIFSEFCIGK